MKAEEIDIVSSNSVALRQIQSQAAAKNWLEVNYQLQQLPCLASPTHFQTTEAKVKAQVIELALQVLIAGDFQQKWHVAKMFPLMGQDILPSLAALADPEQVDNETQWFVASILGNFKTQVAVIALAKILQTTQEPDLIAIAAKSLTQIGDLAVATLINLLEKPPHRLVAAKSLAHIRLVSALPTLCSLAADTNPEIRLLAIEALGSFHSPEVTNTLLQALQDTSSLVRKEAVTALGFRQNIEDRSTIVEQIAPLLYDINLDVCRQTAIALSRMKSESASKLLNLALQSEQVSLVIKIDIVKSLAWSEVGLALDYLLDYLEVAYRDANEIICQEIITVLGRISTRELKPKAIAILQNFWFANHPDRIDFASKKALVTALGELRAVTAQDILKQLAQDTNKTIQLYALASLKKIGIKPDSTHKDVVS